jgi:hypothetical protein
MISRAQPLHESLNNQLSVASSRNIWWGSKSATECSGEHLVATCLTPAEVKITIATEDCIALPRVLDRIHWHRRLGWSALVQDWFKTGSRLVQVLRVFLAVRVFRTLVWPSHSPPGVGPCSGIEHESLFTFSRINLQTLYELWGLRYHLESRWSFAPNHGENSDFLVTWLAQEIREGLCHTP